MKKPDIAQSKKLFETASKIIPSGTQTFSKGVTQFVKGFAPVFLHHGKGARVWDVDENQFIDYVMGCHPLILGYADPDINAAIVKQLELGSLFSLPNKLEIDVSQLFIETVPCAEAVRFGKNGADATTAAVRVARAVTGRDHIAYCGYHGWHDWYIANTDLNSGIPDFNKGLSHSFTYNNLDSLEEILTKYHNQVACVIMEPLTILEPENNFLQEVKKMAHAHGALLIFDEIITGFRFAVGGAQELTGVTPDLATFAKAISNGIPISALVGKKEYMFSLEKTFFSFTYGGDCVGLAAANACIPKIRDKNVPDHLNRMGTILKKGINQMVESYSLPDFIQCVGYPCRTILSFDGCGRFDPLELKSYVQQELLRRGILWAAYHALSYSHDEKIIETTLNAFEDVFKNLKGMISNNVSIRSAIEGEPVEPVFRNVADFNSFSVGKKGQD